MTLNSRLGKLETIYSAGKCRECRGKGGIVAIINPDEPEPSRESLKCRTCGRVPDHVIFLPEKDSLEQGPDA